MAMKSDKQSLQQQEREREIDELRERANPISMQAILSRLILTVIVVGTFINSQINEATNDLQTIFGLLLIFCLLIMWLFTWVIGSQAKERVEQMSIEELRLEFEKYRKFSFQLLILLAVGILCWSFCVLVGIFDFQVHILATGFGGIAWVSFIYWREYGAEKKARKLSE